MSHSVLYAGASERRWAGALGQLTLASVLVTAVAGADAPPTGVLKTATPARAACDDEGVRRSTAVTLNYCRASFYRIQRFPSLRVLVEEQEKILNNLDLNSIADQEVVKLYTGVLVEISEVRLADRERHVLNEKYRTGLGTALTGDAFDFGTQVASGQYLSAIRTVLAVGGTTATPPPCSIQTFSTPTRSGSWPSPRNRASSWTRSGSWLVTGISPTAG